LNRFKERTCFQRNPVKATQATRRHFLAASAALLASPHVPAAPPTPMQMWKSPTCGCCKDWVAHVEAAGFAVTTYDEGNTDARKKLGIPLSLGSCHTVKVGDYALEGHVPAREIRRLLREKPKAIGLAAAGMPLGSPGMDGPAYGGRKMAYDVLLVLADGSTKVYQHYPA
jgi:hypothetical protein